MKTTSLPVLLAVALFAASCTDPITSVEPAAPGNQDAVLGKRPAGSDYVPGTDITAQLRNDLNSGLDIAIPAGHFYLSENIVVMEYSGTIKGAGRDETILEAAQGFKASSDPFPVFPPEAEFTEMLSLYRVTGDVTIKALTMLVTGAAPAEVHDNFWFPGVTTIDNVLFVGSVSPEAEVDAVTVTYKDLRIHGENSADPGAAMGKNMIYPIVSVGWYIPGWSAEVPFNVVVKDCEIEGSAWDGISYFYSNGGSGEFKDNSISNSLGALYLSGVGWAEVKGNRFANFASDPFFDDGGIAGYCFKGNWLDGAPMPNDCQ